MLNSNASIKTENCMVCGRTLQYLASSRIMKCIYCGVQEQAHITCPEEHYICDKCHNLNAMAHIENITSVSTSKDPMEIAELMLSVPSLPMLGCHHAYIAGAALMTAIKNEGSRSIISEDIKEVFRRTERQAHGGYCGLTGVCGIVPAAGAVFSVLTGSKCGKDLEQKITMEAVTRVTRAITELTGPSCCKAYVRRSIEVAAEFLKEALEIELPLSTPEPCIYPLRHPHGCRKDKCPYYRS